MLIEKEQKLVRRAFPLDFAWGAATAAYQIEGAANEDGRGPSIWDTFSHTPGLTANGDTGDVACDHYHRYKEDVALMKSLGFNSYRFSISWPRILPEGTGKVNEAGLDFYSRLVDELLAQNIQPYATLYHWDLPQALEDKGGWSNRETAYAFAEYAEVVVKRLGDRVKGWITLNEPAVSAFHGYLTGEHAPGIRDINKAVRSMHHLLLAHGLAIPVLRKHATRADAEFGVTLNFSAIEPGADTDKAREVATIADAWDNRSFLDPIFKGKYPAATAHIMNQYLPLESDDLAIISTPLDFLGVNYYFRTLAVDWEDEATVSVEGRHNPGAQYTAMNWEVYPEGLYNLLMQFHKDYHIQKLYITENGAAFEDKVVSEAGGEAVHDPERTAYIQQHFEAALKAMQEGAPLAGYFVWSLLDNFEWARGYDKRFGLVYVDYKTQKRIVKDSALWYKQFLLD